MATAHNQEGQAYSAMMGMYNTFNIHKHTVDVILFKEPLPQKLSQIGKFY